MDCRKEGEVGELLHMHTTTTTQKRVVKKHSVHIGKAEERRVSFHSCASLFGVLCGRSYVLCNPQMRESVLYVCAQFKHHHISREIIKSGRIHTVG